MNPAPASAADVAVLRKAYLADLGADMATNWQRAIVTGAAYKEGDPEAVIARYRIHFKYALKRSEDYEKLMERMRKAFFSQGKAGIVKARAVEDRLMADTWNVPGYDLMPRLSALRIPTIVIGATTTSSPRRSRRTSPRPSPTRAWSRSKTADTLPISIAGDVRRGLDDFFRVTAPPARGNRRAARTDRSR